MKKIIKEQESNVDLIQFRDVYKCPFLIGAEFGSSKKFGSKVMKRTASENSPKKNYIVGDILYIKPDYTYDVVRDNKVVKQGLPWKCSTLGKNEVKPTLSSDQEKSVEDKIKFYKSEDGQPLYQRETPTADQMSDFEKVNLKNEPGFGELIKFDYFIWKRKGLRQTSGPQQKAIISSYIKQGYEDLGGKLNPAIEDKYETIDLKSEYPEEFPNSYKLYKRIESLDTNQVIRDLNNFIKQKNYGDVKFCRDLIRTYDNARKLNAPAGKAEISNWKRGVSLCANKHEKFFDLNTTNKIISKLKTDETNYGFLKPSTKEMQESTNLLKNIVREQLEKTALKKKEVTIVEKKNIRENFYLIAESNQLRTERQKEKFFKEIISEINSLSDKGYDRKIINEQFWDMLKGVFGSGAEGIMETFKEYLVKLAIKKLTPMDPDGWVSTLISTSVGNLDMADIPKLTDCGFVTKLLSKSAVESVVSKMGNKAELSGPFYSIIRNSIFDALDKTELARKVEDGIASYICPSISKIKGKMGDLATKAKESVNTTLSKSPVAIQSNE